MAVLDTLLRPTEAAVVAGVPLREVNRVIDEGILPEDFIDNEHGRRVASAACLLIAFYVDSAEQLTPRERRFVVDVASARLRKENLQLFGPPANEDWTVTHGFVAVDLTRFVRSIAERRERLSAAEGLVSISPHVLSGTPVIKGTRVPVHDVAALAAGGTGIDEILETYPGITMEHIDLASLYAQANPPRGRPRGPTPPPAGARIIKHNRLPRRRQTAE